MRTICLTVALIVAAYPTANAFASSTELDLATQAVASGKYKAAKDSLEKAIRAPIQLPKNRAIAWNNLGWVEVRTKNFEAAISSLTNAIESAALSEKQLSIVYTNRGIAYLNLAREAEAKFWKDEHLKAALRDLTEAQKFNKGNAQAYVYLSQVYDMQGNKYKEEQAREKAQLLATENSEFPFFGNKRPLYIDRNGLLLGNKLEWFLGAIIVFVYCYRRFNTPREYTASTTILKYHFAGVSYYVSSLLLFLLIASLVVQSPNLLSVFGIQTDTLPADVRNLSGPLLTALLLTALLPHAPVLSRIDKSLLAFFRRMGQIPIAAQILSGQLRRTGIKIPEKSFRQGFAEPIDAKQHIGNFVDRRLRGLSRDDLTFAKNESMGSRLATAIWLFDEINSWEHNTTYRSISDLFTRELLGIKKSFEKFTELAARYFELKRQHAENESQEETSHAITELQDRCEEVYDNLFRRMCDLVAGAVLRREFSARERKFKLDQIGFNMPGPTISFDNLIGISLLIFVILLTCMSVLGAVVQQRTVSETLLIVTMVTVIYIVAVSCAILPKSNWAFANIRGHRTRPYAAYVLSALLAVAIGIVVSIIFKAIQFQDFYIAVLQLKYNYPWFYLSFVFTLVIAYLADSHVIPPLPHPLWLNFANKLSHLSERLKDARGRSVTMPFFNAIQRIASYIGGDRTRYNAKVPLWILLFEASIAAGVMATTVLFAYDSLAQIRDAMSGTAQSSLAIRPLPERVVPLVANALIAFVIGLLVPYWHRRSLEIESNSSLAASDDQRMIDLKSGKIRNLNLFRNFEDDEFEQVWRSITLHNFPSGTQIISRDTFGGAIYIVVSGMARAERRLDGGQSIEIATFHPGNLFGENSLFKGSIVQADVNALQNCEVIMISKDAFKSIFEAFPSTISHIARVLMEDEIRKIALEAKSQSRSEAEIMSRYEARITDVFQISQGNLDLEGGDVRAFHPSRTVA